MRGTARLLLARLGLQKLDVHVGSIDAEEAVFSLIVAAGVRSRTCSSRKKCRHLRKIEDRPFCNP